MENRRLVRRSGVELGPGREKESACQGEAKSGKLGTQLAQGGRHGIV